MRGCGAGLTSIDLGILLISIIYSTVTFSYSFTETFRIATSPSLWEGEGHFPLTASSGQSSRLVESELVACVGLKTLFKEHDKGSGLGTLLSASVLLGPKQA